MGRVQLGVGMLRVPMSASEWHDNAERRCQMPNHKAEPWNFGIRHSAFLFVHSLTLAATSNVRPKTARAFSTECFVDRAGDLFHRLRAATQAQQIRIDAAGGEL